MNKIKFAKISVILMTVISIMVFSSVVYAEGINDTPDVNTNEPAYSTSASSKHEEKNMGRIILTAAGISIVVTAISVFMIWNSYKTNGQTEPYPYDEKAPLELTASDDILVDTHVERERINRDGPPRDEPHPGGPPPSHR